MNNNNSDETVNDVMNFLNEISHQYPNAISFASGRPTEQHFSLAEWLATMPEFISHFARARGISDPQASRLIGQYGKTNGIINDLLAEQLAKDHDIICSDNDILVTNGCQEAIAISLHALFHDSDEVLLVCNPTYIGIVGVAKMQKINVSSVDYINEEVLLCSLKKQVEHLLSQGKRPRAFYVMPDFDNPSGQALSLDTRLELINYCAGQGIAILEDNPYGMFRYQGAPLPSLYALDDIGCVIYLGTFAKTLCPALRIGYLTLPGQWFGSEQAAVNLMGRLSQFKSYLSVNTSQISQAIIGGVLLANDCSVSTLVAGPKACYQKNRDIMLQSLQYYFSDLQDQICWNTPQGGFFIKLTLPFVFDSTDVQTCAEKYQVICMPLSYFSQDSSYDCCVRLAFSNLAEDEIRLGIRRFSEYVHSQLLDSN